MMDVVNILVIGTDPPCPRCDLLTLRVLEAAEALGQPIELRHVLFDSAEAASVGRLANRRVATPKDISAETRIPVDWDRVDGLIEERRRVVGPEARPAHTWTPAIDALIDRCRSAAKAAGFFMTPILVVNGIVQHDGSVPTVEQIRDWLASA